MKQSIEEFLAKVKNKFGETIEVIPPEEPVQWTKVILTCKCAKHGNFYKTPYKLLNSSGCPKCATFIKRRLTFEAFVKKAHTLHENRYSYSEKKYTGVRSKIDIKCKIHGVFTQRVSDHLSGHGCPTCSKQLGAAKHVKLFTEFLVRAAKVHGNKYSYAENSYKGTKNKLQITCPTHGKFTQAAYSHLKGVGCPSCALSGFDAQKPAILYYLKINGGQVYKIGITNKTVRERFSNTELQVIEVLHTAFFPEGGKAYQQEQRILQNFKHAQYTGNPILESGNTELFVEDITKGYTWEEFLATYQ